MTNLRTMFKKILVKWVVSKIDANAIRNVLSGLLAKLQEKADDTETPFDDAWVAALEYIIAQDGHLEVCVDYVKKLISDRQKGICEGPSEDGISDVAMAICKQPDGICESSTLVTVIIQVLQVVLPMIVDYLTSTKEEESK